MRFSTSTLAVIVVLTTIVPGKLADGIAEASPAKLAKEGNIDAIAAFSDHDPKGEGDAKAYKWLVVAQDYGYQSADNAIDNVLEVSSLRYDDDGLVVGEIHYELGLAYLTGADGLPKNSENARKNLRASLPSICGVTREIEADREQLVGEARSIFDSVFPPQAEICEETPDS